MRLRDDADDRAVEFRPVAVVDDGVDGERVVVDTVVEDGDRRWTLTASFITVAEARDLAAWLAGIAEDATAGADEWTSLTFAADALSISGHRVPGGTVELRIAVLRMRTARMSPARMSAGVPGTTDVVVGLRAPQDDVLAAARTLVAELDALP